MTTAQTKDPRTARLRSTSALILSWVLALVLATFAAAGATVYVSLPWSVPVALFSFLFVAASVVTAVQRDLFGLTRTRARR